MNVSLRCGNGNERDNGNVSKQFEVPIGKSSQSERDDCQCELECEWKCMSEEEQVSLGCLTECGGKFESESVRESSL